MGYTSQSLKLLKVLRSDLHFSKGNLTFKKRKLKIPQKCHHIFFLGAVNQMLLIFRLNRTSFLCLLPCMCGSWCKQMEERSRLSLSTTFQCSQRGRKRKKWREPARNPEEPVIYPLRQLWACHQASSCWSRRAWGSCRSYIQTNIPTRMSLGISSDA